MKEIDYKDLISQKEAAELRGVSRAAINELIKRGRLEVIEIGGKKFLKRSEVENFEGQKGKKIETDLTEVKPPERGRPAKAKKND